MGFRWERSVASAAYFRCPYGKIPSVLVVAMVVCILSYIPLLCHHEDLLIMLLSGRCIAAGVIE